jgi:DNA-binding NtrC family response regulator
MSKHVLLAEPDAALRAVLRVSIRSLADVVECPDFPTARARLSVTRYDWLITNLRLDAYNGLHLVHLVVASKLPTRSLVYGDRQDVELAREAQRVGAFYESRDRVPRALATYIRGTVPSADRRNPAILDRRSVFRGGRRCSDVLPS